MNQSLIKRQRDLETTNSIQEIFLITTNRQTVNKVIETF